MELDYSKRNRKKSLAIQYQYLNEKYLNLVKNGINTSSKSKDIIDLKKQMEKIKELYDSTHQSK